MSVEQRRGLIEPGHGQLSIVRQCELVSISRSSFYRRPVGEAAETLGLMRLIDAQFLETPWYGSRQMARHLRRDGQEVGRRRVRRLMTRMGLAPTLTCCGTWLWIVRTRFGVRISRTSRCGGGFCIWSR